MSRFSTKLSYRETQRIYGQSLGCEMWHDKCKEIEQKIHHSTFKISDVPKNVPVVTSVPKCT